MTRLCPAAGARGLPALLLLSLAAGCGDAGRPGPGSADPCDSPVGPALGCPADRQLSGAPNAAVAPSAAEVCDKLISCGVLAGEYLERTGTACQTNAECGNGECLRQDGERRCHQHKLDYFWCVGRFDSARIEDPCNREHVYTGAEKAVMMGCIDATPCAALGLPISGKLSNGSRDADKFICNDRETEVRTATTCDHGMLRY